MTDMTTMLAEIPDLAVEVAQTADAPNPAPRADRHIRSTPGSRPTANITVIDLLRTDALDNLVIADHRPATSHLLDRLGMCVRMVAEERAADGLDGPEESYGTWAGVTGYLTATAPWWASVPGLNEDVDWEIRKVHQALQQAARVPREPRYVCDQCGDFAHPQPGGQWMLCESGHQMLGEGAVRAKLQATRPMTAAAMEREWGETLGLRAKTISEWSRRGLLAPSGTVLIDRRWRPTFEPWDVMQVLQRHAGAVDMSEPA